MKKLAQEQKDAIILYNAYWKILKQGVRNRDVEYLIEIGKNFLEIEKELGLDAGHRPNDDR